MSSMRVQHQRLPLLDFPSFHPPPFCTLQDPPMYTYVYASSILDSNDCFILTAFPKICLYTEHRMKQTFYVCLTNNFVLNRRCGFQKLAGILTISPQTFLDLSLCCASFALRILCGNQQEKFLLLMFCPKLASLLTKLLGCRKLSFSLYFTEASFCKD